MQVLGDKSRTFVQLASHQKFENAPVHGDQSSGIVVPAIDQHHTHSQLADQLLVERLQAAVPMKPDQQGVELQIESHRLNPVDLLDRSFVTFQRASELREQIRAFGFCRQYGGDFQQVPYLINLSDVPERYSRNTDPAMSAAPPPTFE